MIKEDIINNINSQELIYNTIKKEIKEKVIKFKDDYNYKKEIKKLIEKTSLLLLEYYIDENIQIKILDDEEYNEYIYFQNLYNYVSVLSDYDLNDLNGYIRRYDEYKENGYIEQLYMDDFFSFEEEILNFFDCDIKNKTKYYDYYGINFVFNFENNLIEKETLKKLNYKELLEYTKELKENIKDFCYSTMDYIPLIIFYEIENKKYFYIEREEEKKLKEELEKGFINYFNFCKDELLQKINNINKDFSKIENKEIKEIITKEKTNLENQLIKINKILKEV